MPKVPYCPSMRSEGSYVMSFYRFEISETYPGTRIVDELLESSVLIRLLAGVRCIQVGADGSHAASP